MPAVATDTLVLTGSSMKTIHGCCLDGARPQELAHPRDYGAGHSSRKLGRLKAAISAHILGMPAIDAALQSD